MSNSFVHIETRPGLGNGYGTRITTAEGAEVLGIRRIDISIGLDQVNTATLEIYSSAACDAFPYFQVRDPETGALKRVRRIEFADGSAFVAAATLPPNRVAADPRIYLDQDTFENPARAPRTTSYAAPRSSHEDPAGGQQE